MLFVTGIGLTAVSILFLGLCYIGTRNPKKPFWAGDFLVGCIYVPGAIMVMSFSFISFYWFIKDYSTTPLTAGQEAAGLAVAIAAVVLWRLMAVKKRVAAYVLKGSGTVIKLDFLQEDHTVPPVSGGKAA